MSVAPGSRGCPMSRTLAVPVLLLLAGVSAGRPQESRELPAAVAAALERAALPADIPRTSAALASLGSAALEPLFEQLLVTSGGRARDVVRSASVLGALAQLPREDVLAFLTRLARGVREDRRREAALDLLGRLGSRADLTLALELGTPSDPQFPPRLELRAALESALLGICARERGAPRTLAGYFAGARPGAQATIATVVARSGGAEAASLLAALLGSAGNEADGVLLLELTRVAALTGSEDALVLERVRGMLGHPDSRLAALACLALAQLRDHQAVPDLIVLLSDEDPSLRRGAHATLTSLTGLVLPADAQPWIAWLDESFAWWEERAEPCRVALVSGTPAEAAAALHETAGQRLFVHEVVGMLELVLLRPESDLLQSACRALGAIPERAARAALAPLVAHPDPEVAERARIALERHERPRPPVFAASRVRVPARSRNP